MCHQHAKRHHQRWFRAVSTRLRGVSAHLRMLPDTSPGSSDASGSACGTPTSSCRCAHAETDPQSCRIIRFTMGVQPVLLHTLAPTTRTKHAKTLQFAVRARPQYRFPGQTRSSRPQSPTDIQPRQAPEQAVCQQVPAAQPVVYLVRSGSRPRWRGLSAKPTGGGRKHRDIKHPTTLRRYAPPPDVTCDVRFAHCYG